MSLKVLVIPEDPTHNGYILKPLLEAILTDIGRPSAKVTVLGNPRVQGFDDAKRAIEEELPVKYAFMPLWVFVPDVDRAGQDAMKELERRLADSGINLICSPAVPELEIYCCAARSDELGVAWKTARQHSSFKETYFEPFLRKFGSPKAAGGGRRELVQEAIRNLPALYMKCPELALLRDRIRAVLIPR
jgi:hypothetical protein